MLNTFKIKHHNKMHLADHMLLIRLINSCYSTLRTRFCEANLNSFAIFMKNNDIKKTSVLNSRKQSFLTFLKSNPHFYSIFEARWPLKYSL